MPLTDDTTVYFARTNFRGQDRVFGVKARDRRQHMYVVGKTGCGKSVMLKNLAIQDIRNGAGVAVVDPHGELADEIVAAIPPHRINDVVYFNPADTEYPIGFNVLEVSDPMYKHVVASDLMGIFTKIWANVWSARMEYIMQNCILALLDTPGTTLLGVPRILVDRDYRGKIIANVKDPVVRSFWTQEYENYTDRLRSEAIVPIQNKVGQFLNTSLVRNIVGQPTSSFNVQEVMNSGKILIVNVSKGRIGEDNSALLGAMIITKLQLGAMERVRISENERKDFYLYVDEFQNFATDSFASVLSEARKYRLNLIIAHQYINQLVTDVSTKVRDAVFGNTGTLVVFRVGAADAEYLETEYEPEFEPQDIVNLPNYHTYLKLMVNGVTSRPFSATTLPPIPVNEPPDTKDKVIKVARERYASKRAEVEERIMRWSGIAGIEEGDAYGAGASGAVVAGSGRFGGVKAEFEAVCASCRKQIKVPFEPDPRRPVYCPNCLKRVKEGEVLPVSMPRGGGEATFSQSRKTFSDDSLASLGIEFNASPTTDQNDERRLPSAGRSDEWRLPMQDQKKNVEDTRKLPVRTSVSRPVADIRYKSPTVTQEPLFDAICARCGKGTKVNFKPDPRRPVYCKLCFPMMRSEEMRGRPLHTETIPSAPRGQAPSFPHRPPSEMWSHRQKTNEAPRREPLTARVKTLFTGKPISLKDALQKDALSFSGKRLKRKEVNLDSLREALKSSFDSQELPDAPLPNAPTILTPTAKGIPLKPGQKVTL